MTRWHYNQYCMWPVPGLVWYLYRHSVIPVLVMPMEPLWHCPFDNVFFFFFLKVIMPPPHPPNKTSPFGQIARWTASISIQNLHPQPFCIPLRADVQCREQLLWQESFLPLMLKIQLHYVPFGHMDIIRGNFFFYHILKKGTSLSHPSDSVTAAYVFFTRITGWRIF